MSGPHSPGNPPAFPVHPQVFIPGAETLPDGPRQRLWAGMTLWDHFAGQALAGVLARQGMGNVPNNAQLACSYADAMLAERERRGIGK